MRYQVFASREATEPAFTAPWKWLVTQLAAIPSLNWTYYRLVDADKGITLTEWAQAERVGRQPPSN